jgi:AcrR family transcriptional regulator
LRSSRRVLFGWLTNLHAQAVQLGSSARSDHPCADEGHGQARYDGASVADIAKAARLTPGLVHYHFKSKQEILLELLASLVARHDSGLEARLAAASDPVAGVAAFMDFHLGLGADADPEALACWILLSGEALRDKSVRSAFEQAVARTRASLAAVLVRGRSAACSRSIRSRPRPAPSSRSCRATSCSLLPRPP